MIGAIVSLVILECCSREKEKRRIKINQFEVLVVRRLKREWTGVMEKINVGVRGGRSIASPIAYTTRKQTLVGDSFEPRLKIYCSTCAYGIVLLGSNSTIYVS